MKDRIDTLIPYDFEKTVYIIAAVRFEVKVNFVVWYRCLDIYSKPIGTSLHHCLDVHSKQTGLVWYHYLDVSSKRTAACFGTIVYKFTVKRQGGFVVPLFTNLQ